MFTSQLCTIYLLNSLLILQCVTLTSQTFLLKISILFLWHSFVGMLKIFCQKIKKVYNKKWKRQKIEQLFGKVRNNCQLWIYLRLLCVNAMKTIVPDYFIFCCCMLITCWSFAKSTTQIENQLQTIWNNSEMSRLWSLIITARGKIQCMWFGGLQWRLEFLSTTCEQGKINGKLILTLTTNYDLACFPRAPPGSTTDGSWHVVPSRTWS